jgi:short-chain Z-isoprenyl diphosphate synthase
MGLRDLLYGAYARRVALSLDHEQIPRHVGVILDGNRRWAKAYGEHATTGHRRGADKIHELLGWCEELDVEVVTLWLLSTDNLNRPTSELEPLLGIIEQAVTDWPRPVAGACTPSARSTCSRATRPACSRRSTRVRRTATACTSTSRSATAEDARSPTPSAPCCTSRRLSASRSKAWPRCSTSSTSQSTSTRKGQPDPDLVIRTSGEQRLSGFLLWQSAHSEFYFCEAYWPDFRKVDFLRAIRAFAARSRRFGS